MSRVCYARTLRTTRYVPTYSLHVTYQNVLYTQPGHLTPVVYTTCVPRTVHSTRTCSNYRITTSRTVPGHVVTSHIPYTTTVRGYATQITTHYTTSCTTVRVIPPQQPPPTPPPQTVTTTQVDSVTLTPSPDPSSLFITTTEQFTEFVNTVPESVTTSSSSSESSRNAPTGPIIGGVVGGVVGAFLLGFLVYHFFFKKASGKAFRRDGSSDEKQSGSDRGLFDATLNGQGQSYDPYQDGQTFQYANAQDGQGQLVQQLQYAPIQGQYVPQANGSYYAMQGAGIEQNQNLFQTLDGQTSQAGRLSQVMGTLDISAAAVPGSSFVGAVPGVISVARTGHADGSLRSSSQSTPPVMNNDTGTSSPKSSVRQSLMPNLSSAPHGQLQPPIEGTSPRLAFLSPTTLYPPNNQYRGYAEPQPDPSGPQYKSGAQ